jgi:hypothetical protein
VISLDQRRWQARRYEPSAVDLRVLPDGAKPADHVNAADRQLHTPVAQRRAAPRLAKHFVRNARREHTLAVD